MIIVLPHGELNTEHPEARATCVPLPLNGYDQEGPDIQKFSLIEGISV